MTRSYSVPDGVGWGDEVGLEHAAERARRIAKVSF
jgi:hypothetical protein